MKRYQQGFTLLEVMLVMTLMALVVSGVMLTIKSRGPEDEMRRQAHRFKVAMTMAADRAMLMGEELGLVVTDNSYRFVRWDKSNWVELSDDKALKSYEVEDGAEIELELTLDGLPWKQESLFESDDSLFEDLFSDEEDEKKLMPQVFIYSYGEFSDFNLKFKWEGDEPFTINAAGLTYKVELLDDDEIESVEFEG